MKTRVRRSHRQCHRLSARGFSLLEVVIAMTILAMISTTLFALIRSAVKGGADIQRVQRENDQLSRFLELCRQTFQTMPASAQFKLTALGQTSDSSQELEISGVPFCFGFGTNPISYEATTITLRPDLAKPMTEDNVPRYNLAISRKDIIPTNADNQGAIGQTTSDSLAADEQGRFWMPVLPGVVLMKWRFFKDSTDEWLEEWSDSKWPELIELQLQMEGRAVPLRLVWATPEMMLRSPTRSAPASSSSSSSSKSGTPPR